MPTAWTMVGPGGRPQLGRPVSGTPSVVPVSNVVSPVAVRGSPVPVRTPSEPKPVKASPQPVNGVEEFQKWCRAQLKSLTGVNCIHYKFLINC
jgi:hypothetical protein